MKKKIVLKKTGITIVIGDPVTIADDGYGDTGMGVRKHGDRFSPVTGAKMELKSLLSRHYNHNKFFREQAWEEFFEHPWVIQQKELEEAREKNNQLSAVSREIAKFYIDLIDFLATQCLKNRRVEFIGLDQVITTAKFDRDKPHEI